MEENNHAQVKIDEQFKLYQQQINEIRLTQSQQEEELVAMIKQLQTRPQNPYLHRTTGEDNSASSFDDAIISISPNFSKFIRMDVPKFDGSDSVGWTFKVEQFFNYYSIPEDQRLIISSFHLDGLALSWFQWAKSNNLINSWKGFLEAIRLRFGPSLYEDHKGALAKLHQKPILFTGHDCRTRLYHLEAIDEDPDCIMEDDNDEILEDTSTENLGDKPAEISFHALVGQQNPSTIRLTRVSTNHSLHVLIDNGSTHNFVKDQVAKIMKWPIVPTTPFRVLIGNGESLLCTKKCLDVKLHLQTHEFKFDLVLLPIKGADVILGIQWVEELGAVLECLSANKLFAKLSKCQFCQNMIDYLRHLLFGLGLQSDPDKVQAMQHWTWPSSLKHLCGFLGLTGYYRQFIRHYATVASPLTDLLQKDAFQWSSEAQKAFDHSKKLMTQLPVLALTYFSKDFVLETDASSIAIGAVLMQEKHPIAYFSKKMTPIMAIASAYVMELFAITKSVMNTCWVIQTPEQQQYLCKLLGYNYSIVYKAGKENQLANDLPRIEEALPHSAPISSSQLQLAVSRPELDISGQLQNLTNPELIAKHEEITKGLASPEFTIRNGLLYHNHRLFINSQSNLRHQLMYELHSTPSGGHTRVLRTMFEALYGRKPPIIPSYNSGSSSIEAVEDDLQQRDQILIRLKYTLHQSQARMNCLEDQKSLDKQLDVGSWVLLKFQPYRQHFLVRRTFHKRSKKYYGPYEIEATIRKGSYKLTLPVGSQILPVFHISLLKPYYGPPPQAVCQLPTLSINNQLLISLLTIVGERTVLNNDKPIQQVLVQWHRLLPEDTTWENLHELQLEFSALNLEDKVILHGVGTDRSLHQGLTSEPESNQGIEEMNGDQVDNIQRRAQRKPMWMGDYVMNQLK
ncbi:uncharacterized protein LOC143883132 [Tasmannia lanceolata]|uniref:uncharacterized protein LOC143883132 n=1 Tax=Tasmannia lanceolata TaxID=3420 RepID=UPI0040632835